MTDNLNIKQPAIALLTIEDAAAYLKVGPRTIHRMIDDQRLIAYKVGRLWRIRTDDLLRCAFAHSSFPAPEKLKAVVK